MGFKKNFIIGCGLAATCPQLVDLIIALFLIFIAILVNFCWIDSVFFKPKREAKERQEQFEEGARRLKAEEDYKNSYEYKAMIERQEKRQRESEAFRKEAEENRRKWGYR